MKRLKKFDKLVLVFDISVSACCSVNCLLCTYSYLSFKATNTINLKNAQALFKPVNITLINIHLDILHSTIKQYSNDTIKRYAHLYAYLDRHFTRLLVNITSV